MTGEAVLLIPFVCMFVLGIILYLWTALARLIKGDTKLRPSNAAKLFLFVFPLNAALLFAATLIFPSYDKDMLEILIFAGLLSLFTSLSTTAYRKSR
jgi:hypothetical protein